jgi:hypothetical protein
LNYICEECGFHPFFFFPSLQLVLCNYVLDRLLGGFNCLFSLSWFNFVLWLTWFLARFVCSFSPWPEVII